MIGTGLDEAPVGMDEDHRRRDASYSQRCRHQCNSREVGKSKVKNLRSVICNLHKSNYNLIDRTNLQENEGENYAEHPNSDAECDKSRPFSLFNVVAMNQTLQLVEH